MKAAIDDDGCGTVGCLWFIGLVALNVYGLVHDWTIRDGVGWTLALTFVISVAMIVLDVAQGWWRKWKAWRGG